MTDRRPIIQKYLDGIQPGWVIVKPGGSGDIDDLCIFQKPEEYKEARVPLPVRWFADKEYAKIEREIRRAIQDSIVR